MKLICCAILLLLAGCVCRKLKPGCYPQPDGKIICVCGGPEEN